MIRARNEESGIGNQESGRPAPRMRFVREAPSVHSRNFTVTDPTLMTSPSASGVGPSTRSPLTNVPFVLRGRSAPGVRRRRFDSCVAARHAGVIEPDLRPRIPADDRVAVSERERLALPRQPETGGWALSSCTRDRVGRLRAEGVADAVHSPDEARLLRVVAQRPPDLADQHVEIAFDDEDIRPIWPKRSAFGTTFGRCSIRAHNTAKALGDRWIASSPRVSCRVCESISKLSNRAFTGRSKT